MNIEIPEQAKLNAARINNIALQKATQEGVRDGTKILRTAIAELRLAMAINPLDLGIRMNLATYLHDLGEFDEVESICSFVLKHNDRIQSAWQIMGSIHTMRGNLTDALRCNQRCYDIDPSNGPACWGLTENLLRMGDWATGLPLYERRDEILPKVGLIPNAPRWDGSKTGHLAAWPDQGFGDSLIFSRFLPWARERCDKLTVMVAPEMVPLMGGFADLCTVLTGVNLADEYDHQIRISSLPLVYGLTPHNIPPDPGLISAADFSGHLDGDGLKIGIAWQGNPKFPADRLRSIAFAEFLPFASDPRNTLYSLQVGQAAKDIALHEAQSLVRDMSGVLAGDWARTAAIIKNLDLVVSSCTAIVHLAGSLGVRCFVMLPAAADWRWLSGRNDSPWYPHTTLFRQTAPGDWAGVVKRVQVAIDQLHTQRNMSRLLTKQVSNVVPFDPATMVDMRLPGTADEKEPDVAKALRKILRPGDTFIDVGANVGMHTVLAAELVGEGGKVLAIEPGENALPELCKNCEGLPQVDLVQRPVWSSLTDIDFHLCADGSGGNATWDPGKFPTNFETRANPSKKVMATTTLDFECDKRNLLPRLIKIDTEGAEQRVLEGATTLLSTWHPSFIIAEFHEFGLRELGCTFDSLRTLMAKYGYQTFHLFLDGSRPWRVPDGENLRAPKDFIVNLLFSTEAEVNALWTEVPESGHRTMYGFRVVSEPTEDKVAKWAGAA